MTVNIYFTEETLTRLRKFISKKYGGHHALSLIVQEAVKEYLDKHKKDK